MKRPQAYYTLRA